MTHAWRLTFAYDGDKFTLKSTNKLAKRVPPSQERSPRNVGHFIELRSANRHVLYCRCITELIPDTVEFPTGDPARPLARAAVHRRGEVALLVPALAEGRSVAIVAAGRKPAAAAATGTAGSVTPQDLISVDLPFEGDAK